MSQQPPSWRSWTCWSRTMARR